MTPNEFKNTFSKHNINDIRYTYERACHYRDFEIEHYWKRTTYFWAFIASIAAAYFFVITSQNLDDFNEIELIIACMGAVFSYGWYLANKGSKYWHENWEGLIDRLEDQVTGPLYKTVYNSTSFSVSNINLTLSFVVIFFWFFLIGKFFYAETEFNGNGDCAWQEIIIVLLSLFACLYLFLRSVKFRNTKNDDIYLLRRYHGEVKKRSNFNESFINCLIKLNKREINLMED